METYHFFSFYVNQILLSPSYKKIRKILGKQFGETSHLKPDNATFEQYMYEIIVWQWQ